MRIKREKPEDMKIERSIISSMIVSTKVLRHVKRVYKPQFFTSNMCRIVSGWCLQFMEDYMVSPQHHIEDVFETHVASQLIDTDVLDQAKKFLKSLSEDYEKLKRFDDDYYKILANEYFTKRNIILCAEKALDSVKLNDVEKAASTLTEFSGLVTNMPMGENPFDPDVIQKSIPNDFEENENILFKPPGAVGDLIGNIERSTFFGFLGREKVGKCIDQNTFVPLPNGKILTIKEIVQQKEKKIISCNPSTGQLEISEIGEWWTSGLKECVRTTIKIGRELINPLDHPFLTPNGWETIQNLKPGDYVAVPKIIPFFGTKKLNKKLIRLCGYLLTEGGLYKKETRFCSTFPEIQKDFNICVQSFGSGVYWKDKDCAIRNPKKDKGKHNANPVHELVKQWGLSDSRSGTKFIPDFIFEGNKESIAELLRTMFSCDGSAFPKGIEYCSKSKKMLRQISHLLLRFGIIGRIRSKEVNGTFYWIWQCFDLEHLELFNYHIGFSFHKKIIFKQCLKEKRKQKIKHSFLTLVPPQIIKEFAEQLKITATDTLSKYTNGLWEQVQAAVRKNKPMSVFMIHNLYEATKLPILKEYLDADIHWSKIESIEPVGLRETYDLSVPGNENFIAGDFLVHNSWLAQMFAVSGLTSGLNVALLETGDMTKTQIDTRLGSYVTKKASRSEFSGPQRVPRLDCLLNQTGQCDNSGESVATFTDKNIKIFTTDVFDEDELKAHNVCIECWKDLKKRKTFQGSVWWDIENIEIWSKPEFQNKGEWYNKTFTGTLIREEFPSDTISAMMVRDWLIEKQERDRMIFDLVLVDYADILAPNEKMEFRHQENEKWKTLRRISQEFNNCLITFTQSDAASYKQTDLNLTNYSEDKRKYGHVTRMYAINKTENEEQAGCIRLAPLLIRDGLRNQNKHATILQSLCVGNPHVASFIGRIPLIEKPKES